MTLRSRFFLATGHGRPFDVKAVQWIRHACNIPAPAPYAGGEISVAEAARRLGYGTGVIYYWIDPPSSTPGAAPAAGCASRGPATSRPPAAYASPDPAT